MPIRTAILAFMVAGLAVYAWRDWFKALCGLIVLMAVMEHEDMPHMIMGIQGLNPWNVLMTSILLSWLVSRRREGLKWDMPRHMTILLLLYLGVILIGFLRALFDRSHFGDYTLRELISEELINTVKWVIPGLLLFDGCRTRRRLVMAVVSILALYFLLAALVARRLPPKCAFGEDPGVHRTRMKLNHWVGYSTVDASAAFAGASWGMLAAIPLLRRRRYKAVLLGAVGLTVYAQALTGGRAGYAAWGVTGLALCLIRWRRFLPLAPIVPIILLFLFPAAADRAMEGFGETNVAGETIVNEYDVLSGRNVAWPHVVKKIGGSPLVGYGRLAMIRTGLRDWLWTQLRQAFPHPHNAYLELLLDNGVLGAVPVLVFFGVVIFSAARLFGDRRNPWCAAVGGIALSLVLAQLAAGIGAQHFYPREACVGMWAAIFLMLRVSLEHGRTRATVSRPIPAEYRWISLGLRSTAC